MLPTFIGIGAPRCGTTWLFNCLAEHPDIFMAPVKETNFFDYATIDGRLGEYEAHFAGAERARAVGEISVRYLASPRGAAERIARLLPDVRLFVSLRNPVDQVYSHYWHLLRQNFHQWDVRQVPRSFEEALERYEDRLLEPARYARHLERWLQYFHRSQLHIIFYDDICARPREVLAGLYAHVGVDSAFVPAALADTGARARRGSAPRGGLTRRVYARLYDGLNRRVYYPLKRLIGPRRADQLKQLVRAREVLETFFQLPGYPPMRPETRAVLRAQFARETQALAELTGRDLRHWQ